MNPGELRHKITFYFPSGTKIVDGIETTNYVSGATVYAAFDVKPPKGRQINVAQTDHTVTTRWVKIRYIDGVKSDWIVKFGTMTFNIVSPPIDFEMRHRELYLECEVVE